jgi:TRAP-type C4-dicarboxylate transport system permease small subunit
MRKALDALYLGCGWLAAIFLAGIGALMLGQAVLREVGVLVRGADDITAWFCAATAFLSLPHAFKNGDLVRVGLLLENLSERRRRWAEIYSLAIAAAFIGYMVYSLGGYVIQSWRFNELAQGLIKMPLWIPQSSLLVGATVLFIAVVDELLRVVRKALPSYRIAEEERLARGDYSETV